MEIVNNRKTDVVLDGIDSTANLLSYINPVLAGLTIITFVVRQIIGYASPNDIKKRMKKIEKKLQKKKITVDEFKTKVLKMSEHSTYVARNNLNYILLNCIPETVDLYIELWIDFIMSDDNSPYEELCEILNSMNKNDLVLLEMIKSFIKYGDKSYYLERKTKNEDQSKKQKEYDNNNQLESRSHYVRTFWRDRDLLVDGQTFFWKDFSSHYELNVNEMGHMILKNGTLNNGQETMIWAYYVRSFIKLDKLGILQLDYSSTLGTINSLNIDRFHVTLFGMKLLDYIPLKSDIDLVYEEY